MRFKDLLPIGLKDYIKLVRNKKRFPGRVISTPDIGSDVTLGRMCELTQYSIVRNGVSIGDYSYINRGTIIATGSIGKFCSIGPNCQIGLENHPLHFPSTSPFTYGKRNVMELNSHFQELESPPVIENDVWICGNVVILQGVRIGTGAVICSGAVVTKDVEPYAIVAGVPAKMIKYRFDSDIINYLLESEWWDKSPNEMQKVFEKIK